jgi:NADH-quinone oxidoreductase subunit A
MTPVYLPMFLIFAVAALIAGGMWLAGARLGPKHPTPEKIQPFECGNETRGALYTKVSVKFFLTAILFVVFDLEVVFLYPWAVLMKGLGWLGLAVMVAFVGALLVALAYAWKKGALEWER